ncbi:hypothetical protein ACQ4PT_002419 [Festuca glaucescens]
MCKRPRQQQVQPSQKHKQRKKKHLYLVLDDMEEGFTIRKLDDDADIPDDLLSAPPVARLLSPARSFSMFIAALGGRILAMSNQHPTTLVYDTATAGVAAGPSLPDALRNAYNIFVPTKAGDTMYAFAYYFGCRPPSVEVMSSSSSSAKRSPRIPSATFPSSDWSWRSMTPSPFDEEERMWSYALHPDGHTVFVSTVCFGYRGGDGNRTFSFHTAAAGDRTEWRCHGEWALPFEDQGYYDADLDAWVGLDRDGHIGTCQVPATVPQQRQQRPELDWKVAKDKLWDVERQVQAHRPTLTCMGNARFCLIDRVRARESADDGCNCVLRLTTFRLRHSRKGELQIFDRNTTSCPMSMGPSSFSPVAFWI